MDKWGDAVILDFPLHYRRLKLWPCSFVNEPSASPGFELVVLKMFRSKYRAESPPEFVYHLGASDGTTLAAIGRIFPSASYVGFFRSPTMAGAAREFCSSQGIDLGASVQISDFSGVRPNSLIVAKLPDMPLPRERLLRWVSSAPSPCLAVLEVSDMFGQGFFWSLEAFLAISMRSRVSILRGANQGKKEVPIIYLVVSNSRGLSKTRILATNLLTLLVFGFPVLLESAFRLGGVLWGILFSKLLAGSRTR